MAYYSREKVLTVHHWNDTLFSFTTTRDGAMQFHNGQFLLIGLEVDGKPLMRAYSMVNVNSTDHLEFLSIKVANGALTSRLQHIKPADEILISQKAVGTLVIDSLRPGRHLYLLSTGTGLAPFMSIIRDPATYARFSKVVLTHGVRLISELAYADYLRDELPQDPQLGALVRHQLIYYPTVTREAYVHTGRLTSAIEDGTLFSDIGLPPLDAKQDRVMICGSPEMLKELSQMLNERGFAPSPRLGQQGDYVVERAFAGNPAPSGS